jgi:hypothetical protein
LCFCKIHDAKVQQPPPSRKIFYPDSVFNLPTTTPPIPSCHDASKYKACPFAADALNLDSQFFSFGSNRQDDMIANIEKFVRNSTSQNPAIAGQTAKAVSEQLMNQVQNHSIAGTLIIIVNGRHRNISVFSPLVIDTDKAMQVWNALYPNNKIDEAVLKVI